jgi:hypothetical protein
VVPISFHEDILSWLKKCLSQKETENTPPVREIVKQLINALKSICGYSEDEAMDKEIAELITQSDETIRAAFTISNAAKNLDNDSRKLFEDLILAKVKETLREADWCNGEDNWWAVRVPLHKSQYTLYVNYDWQSIGVWREAARSNTDLDNRIAQKLAEVTGVYGINWVGTAVMTARARYPGLENVDEPYYVYERYRQYAKNPDEAARQIVSIAKALENV